jgi:proteasome lid subunit RPN8/RPN11
VKTSSDAKQKRMPAVSVSVAEGAAEAPPLPMLTLPASLARQIEEEGAAAYPNECCGVMIGRDVKQAGAVRRLVERLEPLKNSFTADEQYHRFSLDPLDLMKAEKSAGNEGKLVLGFYHSHPDHPARPSETDREHAWEFYSYLIVAIHKKQPVDMTSWVLNGERVFRRQDIEETEG